MLGDGWISKRRRRLSLVAVVSLLLWAPAIAATSGAGADAKPGPAWANHDVDNWSGSAGQTGLSRLTNPAGCDPLDPSQCMLPFPNDWFTRDDPTSATGRRLNYNILALPHNVAGLPIDPTDYNRSDGFSVGSTILTVVPGMTNNTDLVPSGLPTDRNLAANDGSDLGVILIDATTGRTWPVWAEIDQYTSESGVLPAGAVGSVQQDLMIHPAENLLNGHRYIVALRHLHTNGGSLAQPSPAFEGYVNDYVKGVGASQDARVAHMDRIFEDLQEAGWSIAGNPSDLYLAWDFTTASTQNVTGDLLAIRDNAFGQLGEPKSQIDAGEDAGRAPSFNVSSVQNFTPAQNANVAREIKGSFTVPCYIAPTCSLPVKCDQISSASPFDDCPLPGSFYYQDPLNPDATPSQVPGQTYRADYICVVGRGAFTAHQLLRPVEYGHGLFGSYTEVTLSPQEEMANREGMMYCATDWFGWSNADIPNALLALADLSNFDFLADRGQQGELNFLYLQRLMSNPGGFASNPAFQYSPGHSLINLTDGVYYDGNSQGGIFGGTVCAVSIDAQRCALGVNGMDYPTLLPRSTDYVATEQVTQFVAKTLLGIVKDPASLNPGTITSLGYSTAFDLFYPDQAQRQLLLDLIQPLWDRDDPDGYAGHMSASAEEGMLPDCTGLGVVKASDQTLTVCDASTSHPGPDHHVLMQIAWGDHQVANFTAFDEARTVGARAVGGPATSDALGGGEALLNSRLCNTNAAGRYTGNDPVDGRYCYAPTSPLWDIPPITSYPYDGSAIVIFDSGPDGVADHLGTAPGTGTDPPPPSDVPPPDTTANNDPHEYPRRTCAAQDQKGAFFDTYGQVTGRDGYVIAPRQPLASGGSLAGAPYFSGGWQGTCSLS